MKWFSQMLALFCLWILSLRYRVIFKGNDFSRLKKRNGILFLPNHTSRLDPIVACLSLYKCGFSFRAVVVEYIFRIPWLQFFLKWFKAVSIPNFENAVNQYKILNGERAMSQILEGLKNNENFLFYPSGKLKKGPREIIGGASGAYSLLEQYPDVQVVLVRITGFWGSSFSRALTGEMPDLVENLLQGFKAILKNGLVFMPRRKILVEMEVAPEPLLKSKTRLEFNHFLEEWYNRYPDNRGGYLTEEPLQIVPLDRWKKKSKPPDRPVNTRNEKEIAPKTKELVYSEIERILDQKPLTLLPEMNLATDLGMDSLNFAELTAFLSRRFNRRSFIDMETIQDVLEIAEGRIDKGSRQQSHYRWGDEPPRPPLSPVEGESLPEALFRTGEKLGSFACCGDDRSGVVSYKKFTRSVQVLAQEFKGWEESRIAVLLPASVGAYITIFALQLAGKIPVILNWTLGPRYLEQMMEISGTRQILTSWNFIDKLSQADFGKWAEHLQFLEDIRKKISLKSKLSTLFGKPSFKKINETAAILFTSGSESAPKGVPLTHSNVLFSARSLLKWFPFDENVITFSVLPPFHSLGFTIAGVGPIIAGVRSVFYPDPTDPLALAEGIERWKINHVSLAPSFLSALLATAKKEQLASVRVFFCGGEKTPQKLFDQVAEEFPQAKMVEGYGVTECAAGVSIGHPEYSQKGVGRALPGVKVMAIHTDNQNPLPTGERGEICISGLNVFSGYLGNVKTPFIQIEGVCWYRTGDIGHVDEEGNIYLSGRLNRFIKIGGEMISLLAIEEALTREILRNDPSLEPPFLAICSEEKKEAKPRIILFSKIPLNRESANEMLRKAGFSSLIKIDHVHPIEVIPVSASGKINYRLISESLK